MEISSLADSQVVTVLELLSPTNKAGSDRASYLSKRLDVLRSTVNLLEFDLLRAGHRPPLEKRPPPSHYAAFVSPAVRRREYDVYSWSVRDPLPTLPIPLREGDPDLRFDFQALFTESYERGRYGRTLPYHAAPPGPFSDEDRVWATEIARAFHAANPRDERGG